MVKVHETVQFTATSEYTVFEINGKFYCIWDYTNRDEKVLQRIDDDFDDVEEICVFN